MSKREDMENKWKKPEKNLKNHHENCVSIKFTLPTFLESRYFSLVVFNKLSIAIDWQVFVKFSPISAMLFWLFKGGEVAKITRKYSIKNWSDVELIYFPFLSIFISRKKMTQIWKNQSSFSFLKDKKLHQMALFSILFIYHLKTERIQSGPTNSSGIFRATFGAKSEEW